MAVQRTDLDLEKDPTRARALAIADNRTAELDLQWNPAVVAELSKQGVDMAPFFLADELAELLKAAEGDFYQPTTDEDRAPATPVRPITKAGDLVWLGEHRLICGDATKPATLERLMDGDQAAMIFTDPPYNVDYEGRAGKIANDKMSDAKFRVFLGKAYAAMYQAAAPGAAIYVCHSDTGGGLSFRSEFIAAGFKLAACLIWAKNALVLGRSDYQWQHEPILYGWKPAKAHSWYGTRKHTTLLSLGDLAPVVELEEGAFQVTIAGRTFLLQGEKMTVQEVQTTLARIEKPKRSPDHPTMKPVALVDRCMRNSTEIGDVVLDPFGGSGTTLISAEKNARKARLAELEPKFCDVIINRWQELTGKKAERRLGN
jgi:DNA modification methylase